ncbi:MAG TPA: hypothetical protein VM533_01925 [Fimbriiglobus sp.]|jgi:hypothetical protein|nr:hypothetical protein [Fimbriiglobus sp.]
MKFRLRCETLETRENPSGPDLLDPVGPLPTPDPTEPGQPAPTEPPALPPIVTPSLGVPYNPWGG